MPMISNAQKVSVDPMLKIGYYPKYNQRVYYVEDLKHKSISFKQDYSIHYYTTIGLRVNIYKSFKVEFLNQVFIQTNNMIENEPYSANFYIKAYYVKNKWKAGYEHLCTHFIQSSTSLTYSLEGGYDELFVSYNF